jgi:ribose-phosphate pyrophosphokinase
MIIFATTSYHERFIEPFSSEASDFIIGDAEIVRYPSGELHVVIHSDVKNQDCLIIGSIAPPDVNLVTLLMMADALKQSGASSVQAYLPYLGYSRQDKFGPHESRGIALIGSLLRASGVDSIITIDTHSDLDRELIGLPLKSISSSVLFVPAIKELNWENITIVAPDAGAKSRAQEIADLVGVANPVAQMVKEHQDNGAIHLSLVGDITERVVIVDDIIDGGRTIISACDLLRVRGVKEIVVATTHGIFSDGAWCQLLELNVQLILISDSCPESSRQTHPVFRVISINQLFPTILKEIRS